MATLCTAQICPCVSADRECDPTLCRTCDAHIRPEHLDPAVGRVCRNVGMRYGEMAHLLIAPSDIPGAGWGLFAKTDIPKSWFIVEYTGEVISQEEAERRGSIYDKKNCSYLFNLNTQYVVDATRCGNKSKFANHSSRPNVRVAVLVVEGDHRIGLYAAEDIAAGDEICLDYRYDAEAREGDLHKRPIKLDWMVKNTAGKR
jgi:histone-lysine N-methyltransferase EZH2